MVRKALIALVWFPLIAILLAVNLSLLISITRQSKISNSLTPRPAVAVASFSDSTEQVLGANVIAADARAILLNQYLNRHSSPLADHADYIVDRAQYYNLDYRLVPAIAMCESIGGKHMPSRDSYNAWGISVETGETTGAKFKNWLSAIDWVSRYLRDKYYSKGITSLIDIGAIYAPPSVEKGNSWARCVQFFMDEIHSNL